MLKDGNISYEHTHKMSHPSFTENPIRSNKKLVMSQDNQVVCEYPPIENIFWDTKYSFSSMMGET